MAKGWRLEARAARPTPPGYKQRRSPRAQENKSQVRTGSQTRWNDLARCDGHVTIENSSR
jgi:hypothetical protein